jgi:hypothetical protein
MATNLQFIKSVTASSGVSTLDISDCFSAEYDVYELYIPKVDLGSNAYLNVRFLKASDGSADTTSNYDSAGLMISSISAFSQNRYTNSSSLSNVFGLWNTSDFNNGGKITIYNPFSSSSYTFVAGQIAQWYTALYGSKHIGVHKVAQSNSGVQLLFSNIDFVQVSIYGVK